MSHHPTFKLCLAIAVLAATLAGSGSLSYGVTGCRPQTPCPCAADGVCRPKRETWGHYKTRWRTWPGEIRGEQPTEADAPTAGKESLPPFETPLPELEDLRGPAKDKKKSKDDKSEASGEGDKPAQLLPGPEALPAIDPQSNQLQMQPLEDAPPQLPESLRQSALLLNKPQARQAQATAAPLQSPVQPASWQQAAPGLINPASAVVIEPEANSLQQAIYYEASDQSDAATE